MANYVSKLLEVAAGEVGYLEKKTNKNLDSKTANAGYNNYTKYARDLDKLGYFYNGKKNGYAWCDVFVDWCFVTAFGVEQAMKLLQQPKRSYGAGVGYSKNYYKKKGQFHKKNPQPGDQIFFYKANLVTLAHTGLVEKVDETYVYTIEGNTRESSGVVANGGGVVRKKYKLNYKRICGYGRPNYDSEPVESKPIAPVAPVAPVVPSAPVEPEKPEKPVVTAPSLKKGDTVKVKKGAKTYAGKGLASFVYNRKHKVKEVSGDRVVITYKKITVAAMHAEDLIKL